MTTLLKLKRRFILWKNKDKLQERKRKRENTIYFKYEENIKNNDIFYIVLENQEPIVDNGLKLCTNK